jgi:hypothetical protein
VFESSAELILVYGPPEVPPRYTLYPATVEVLAAQDKETLCCIPSPVSDSVEEVEALLENESMAEPVPDV